MIRVNIDKLFALQGDLTDTEFAQKIGISRTQLWRIRREKSSVGTTFISKVLKAYPAVNASDIFFVDSVR